MKSFFRSIVFALGFAAPGWAADNVTLNWTVNVPSGIAFVGERVEGTIRIEGTGPATGELRLTTTDQDGRTNREKWVVAESKEHKIVLATAEPGYRLLEFALVTDGRETATLTRAVAVVHAPRDFKRLTPGSYFGLCEVSDREAAVRLGCRNERWGLDWRFWELKKGDYGRLAELAKSLSETREKYGVEVMVTLQPYPPDWARANWKGKPQWAEAIPAPDQYENWKRFVRELTRACKGKLAGLDIQNEPNLHYWFGLGMSYEEAVTIYTKLLNLAYEGAKEGDPNVAFCGLGVGGDYDMDYKYVRGVLDAGAKPGVFTGHPYTPNRFFGPGKSPRWPGDWLAEACRNGIRLMEKHKLPGRMWVGELGWALDPAAVELGQDSRDFAAAVGQALVTCRSVPGVEKHFHFLQRPYVEGGNCYGLFRGAPNGNPMYPLPAATVYATCARFLNLAKPIRKVEIGPGVTAYVFDRNEEAEGVAAIWSNAEARKLAFDAGGVVRVFTGFGQPAGSGSKPSISLGKTPTFLTFALKDLDRVVKGLRGGTVSGGRPVEVNHAYFPSERVLTLCVMNHKNRDTPIEIRIAARKETQILPPGESKVTIQLSAPAGKSVDAVVTADGTGRKVSVPADFHPVHRLAKVAVDGRLAETAGLTEIMLDRRRDVLPPDPTIPWKSPADLSVRVWVGWTDEGLYFAARVCDPVHFAPPAQAEDFWSFDSIQLAIDVRGDSTAGFGPDDLELGLGSAKDGAALYRTWPLPMRPTAGRAVIRRDGTDTVYETLIPWKELGISSPARGKVFPFNFAVNQNNGTGRLYWMGLRPGICESKDPTVYRKFVLK